MAAPKKAQALIETSEDLNFLVFIDRINIAMGQDANSNPSPAGRSATSSTSTKNDEVTITGWVRALKCGVNTVDLSDIVPRLKRTISAQKYTTDEWASITTATAYLTHMRLSSATVLQTGESPQELLITTSWESGNFSGDVLNAAFEIGGVQ